MLMTLAGMVMLVSEVFANADLPIFVTLDGIVILTKDPALRNALFPMLVTLDGMEYSVPIFAAG
jgi:hypothetical protein